MMMQLTCHDIRHACLIRDIFTRRHLADADAYVFDATRLRYAVLPFADALRLPRCHDYSADVTAIRPLCF